MFVDRHEEGAWVLKAWELLPPEALLQSQARELGYNENDDLRKLAPRMQAALQSINMSMDDWQPVWPFDFSSEHDKGTNPDAAAMKANRFWWYQQNKPMGCECDKMPDAGFLVVTKSECPAAVRARRPYRL
jgi:hypothetical protein